MGSLSKRQRPAATADNERLAGISMTTKPTDAPECRKRRRNDSWCTNVVPPTLSSSRQSVPAAAALSLFLLLLPLPTTLAQNFENCLETLQTSDLDSNNILSSFEFNSAVSTFSGASVSELPEVWNQYSSNNVVRYIPIATSKNLHDLCDDIMDGVLGNDYDTKCNTSLNFGDANRDQVLSTPSEFGVFAARFSGLTPLPTSVQEIYNDFESIPVVSPVSDLTEAARAVCRHTGIAALMSAPVQSGTDPSTASPPTAAPVATPSVTLPADFTPSLDPTTCERTMAFSDLSRDNLLNEDEYYRFVTRLEIQLGERYPNYSAFPIILKDTYQQLRGNEDGIDVFGSKPGQSRTTNEQQLTSVCGWTDYAIQKALEEEGPPPSTSAPTPSPIGIDYRKCLTDMIVADLSRDSFLNEQEYVRFIARNDENVDFQDSFANLTQALQLNFKELINNDGLIDVNGSKPNHTPTPEQTTHLKTICQKTGTALEESDNNSSNEGGESNAATVYNSFVVSNSRGIRAAGYTAQDRKELQTVYTEFLEQVLTNFTGDSDFKMPSRRFLRGRGTPRRQLVDFSVQQAPSIDFIYDVYCPNYVDLQRICATVFGSFPIDTGDDSDVANLATQLSQVSQKKIDPYLIDLWENGESTSSQLFRVEGPSYPVDPSKVTDRPDFSSRTSSTSAPVGVIVGCVFLGLLFLGGGTYLWKAGGGRFLCSNRESRKQNKNQVDPDLSQDDDNGIGAYGVESAPGSKVTFRVDQIDDDDSSERSIESKDDSVDFSVDDETEGDGRGGQNVFNAFRRGKKNKSSVEDDIRILDGDSNEFNMNGGDDFVNYAFEEPTELKTKKDDGFGDQDWANEMGGASGWSDWGAQSNDDNFKIDNAFELTKNEEDGSSSSDSGSESESSGADSKMSAGSKVSVQSAQSTVVGEMGVRDDGDWDSYIENGSGLDRDPSESEGSAAKSFSESRNSSSNSSLEDDGFANGDEFGVASVTSEERRKEQFREKVERLVRRACPEEFENIGNMMEQFEGREAELISTLETLAERKDSQRRLKAVHKSKGITERDASGFANGGAEGSAVIAAASMINSDANESVFDDQDSFDDNDSYYSEDQSGSRSYSDDYDDEGSYTGSRSGSGSYTDGDRSYTEGSGRYGDQDDRYYDEGSFTGSRSGTYNSQDDRSYSGSQSYTGSYNSQDDRSYSGSQSYTGSYNSQDDRSHSGSQSYTGSYSGSHTGSRSYTGSYSGSSRSGSYSGSRSYDDEGSFYGEDDQ